MSSPAQSCTIVGQGAIGLLAACRLQRAGWQVGLQLKQPAPIAMRFIDQAGTFSATFQPAIPPLSRILIPVKAYDTLPCLQHLAAQLTKDAQVVVTHNGMPDIPALQACMEDNQGLWFLSTSQAALRSADTLQHTGHGQSTLAPLNDVARNNASAVVDWLALALGPIQLVSDIRQALWQKLAVNAVINPLTALHHCRNGMLAQLRFRKHIQALVKELCQVATAEGIALPVAATQQWVLQVISQTANNFSSMHQDVSHGRPTELAAITGFLLNCAAQHQLALPEHQQLHQALQAKLAKTQGR